MKFTREQLGAVAASNTCVSDVLRELGYASTASGNHKTLWKYLRLWGIDTRHWIGRGKLVGGRKAQLSDILVPNSTYSGRQKLKKKLLSENLVVDSCSVCGQPPVWNGRPLVLQLDHINGVSNDNRLENLRVICPNCHTQTDTFTSRRRPSKLYNLYERPKADTRGGVAVTACKCGSIKASTSSLCSSCSSLCRRTVTFRGISVEELAARLEREPVMSIAASCGVSSAAVSKWCRRRGLSVKGRGYWAKARAGFKS